MTWISKLAVAVNAAIASGEPRTIKVATDAQQGFGERAAARLGPPEGYDPAQITFVVDESADEPLLV